jgi:hypothetical protein
MRSGSVRISRPPDVRRDASASGLDYSWVLTQGVAVGWYIAPFQGFSDGV